MSIDEPIESTQSNVNPNSINRTTTSEPISSSDSNTNASTSDNSINVSSNNTESQSNKKTEKSTESTHNPSIFNSAKNSNQILSTNAPKSAETISSNGKNLNMNGENLGVKFGENFNEKKKKLTLTLGPVNGSPGGSDLSSISSSDSNKPLILGQAPDHKITNNTTNGDLVKHLDNHNISTPYLDKILFEYQNSSGNLGMKTPGSSTIAFLTPNGTFPSNNLLQTQFSYSGLNFFNTAEFKTPSEENPAPIGITFTQNSANQYNSGSISNATYRRQNSEINQIYVNPSEIFMNQDPSNSTIASTPIKYTTLTNVPDMNNGNNQQNSLILTTENVAKLNATNNTNNNNLTGNYAPLQIESQTNPNQSSLQNNKVNSEINNNFNNTNSNMLNNSTNKILNTISIKDEFHTVPEHPPLVKNNQKNSNKRKFNSNGNSNMGNNNKNIKTEKIGSSISSGSADSSVESINNTNSGQILDRRDTGNSSVDSSSNLELYSPINLDNQARMKIEIKRERNREAARKCRTRKLEKIALLEIQVKDLCDVNDKERAKNESLAEEINKIRQKLEMHKKIHNCDLKMI